MEFYKYPSLANHDKIQSMRKFSYVDPCEIWYSTEKIHGANASISVSKDNISYSQRRDIIHSDKGNFSTMKNKDLVETLNLFRQRYNVVKIAQKYLEKGYEQVHIFGEHHGDIFRMGYDKNMGNSGFRVFNVILDDGDDKFMTSLSYEEIKDIFGDDVVPFVDKGKLSELLDKPTLKESLIGGKESEGVVIQPYNGFKYFKDGGFLGIKYKTEKYRENKANRDKSRRKSTYELNPYHEEMSTMVDEVRLENLVSKGTELVKENIGKLIQEMKMDIVGDLKMEDKFFNVNKEDLFKMAKTIDRNVAMLVKSKLALIDL